MVLVMKPLVIQLVGNGRLSKAIDMPYRGVQTLSVNYPTRLETRTKESNMCASQWVRLNLMAQ